LFKEYKKKKKAQHIPSQKNKHNATAKPNTNKLQEANMKTNHQCNELKYENESLTTNQIIKFENTT